MSFDTLLLGPFTFDGFSPPEQMPYGGKQQLVIHKMPGGLRTVDVMGPDDHDPQWSGILFGDSAFSDMQTLNAMRIAGQELPFSWGAESRTAVISEFHAKVEKPNVIHYDITLVYTDDSGAGSGGLGAAIGVDAMIASDLSAALGL